MILILPKKKKKKNRVPTENQNRISVSICPSIYSADVVLMVFSLSHHFFHWSKWYQMGEPLHPSRDVWEQLSCNDRRYKLSITQL